MRCRYLDLKLMYGDQCHFWLVRFYVPKPTDMDNKQVILQKIVRNPYYRRNYQQVYQSIYNLNLHDRSSFKFLFLYYLLTGRQVRSKSDISLHKFRKVFARSHDKSAFLINFHFKIIRVKSDNRVLVNFDDDIKADESTHFCNAGRSAI